MGLGIHFHPLKPRGSVPFLVVSVLWQGKALPTKVPLG